MIRFSPNPNQAHVIRWYEWGEEAFHLAQEQDKPIMLFLTAFWCRYCQRMDEGAFSEGENIALLNAYFVAIRCDDAQRPDVNTRYNLNGWPTIGFMTPGGQLLAATNYLSSEEFGNVLIRVYTTYQEKKEEIRSLEKAQEKTSQEAVSPQSIRRVDASGASTITQMILAHGDHVHGGYGSGQKFIHPDANDFLLSRYEITGDSTCLNHALLTLDKMREGDIHDHEEEGYFRTTSGADWSRPHREKLLAEQAGLLANCLRAFRITNDPVYARMADGIMDYLDRKLSDPLSGAFYGCEDFLRYETTPPPGAGEFFTILDKCIYTDANALAIVAYLEAAELLGKPDRRERALKALDFLWKNCRSPDGSMFHYFDGAPHLAGMLNDQSRMGMALLAAHRNMSDEKFLIRARELAEYILTKLKNNDGGYYDLPIEGAGYLSFRLTLIEQNGAAALFFLRLFDTTREVRFAEGAVWALSAFSGDFSSYGIYAASFGQALGEYHK